MNISIRILIQSDNIIKDTLKCITICHKRKPKNKEATKKRIIKYDYGQNILFNYIS